MRLFKKTICPSCINKNTIKALFLFLVLLTLKLLFLRYYTSLSFQLENSGYSAHLMKMNTNISLKLTFLYSEQLVNGSRNSFTTMVVIKTNSSRKPIKISERYKYIINEPNKCKENLPFLILLVTVERWQQEARQAIRQTWGKEDFVPGVRILRLFLLGKDVKQVTENEKSILEESQEFHDIIQQDFLDTYKNLSIKVLMGMSWVATYCPQALYVMKTDSDIFVNTEYLINQILKPDQPPRTNYFTGCLMKNYVPIRYVESKWYMPQEMYSKEQYPVFCSGTGYVFSGDLAWKIYRTSSTIRRIHLEDVYIGLCLDKLGVKPVASPKYSDFNAFKVSYSDCVYNQIVTSHNWSPEEMIFCWKSLQKYKHLCS